LNTKEAFKAAIDGKKIQQFGWGNMYIHFIRPFFFLAIDGKYKKELYLDFEDDTEWKLFIPPGGTPMTPELEQALLVLKEYFDKHSDEGVGKAIFGDGEVQLDSFNYHWENDEIVENRLVIDSEYFSWDYTEEGNIFLRKG